MKKIRCYKIKHRLPENTYDTIIFMYAINNKQAEKQLKSIYPDVIIIEIKEFK